MPSDRGANRVADEYLACHQAIVQTPDDVSHPRRIGQPSRRRQAGLGTIEGPIIGAVAHWFFADRFSNNPAWYFMLLGGLAVVISLFPKRGVWGSRGVLAGTTAFAACSVLLTTTLKHHPVGYLILVGVIACSVALLNTRLVPSGVRRTFDARRGVDVQLFPVRHRLRQ